MTTFVVTFGQKYRFEEHPACSKIDANAFLRVEAENEMEARQKVIESPIGRDWAFMYEWDEFEPQIAKYGLWDATLFVANTGLTGDESRTERSL